MRDQLRQGGRGASKLLYAVLLVPFVAYLVALVATRFGLLGVLCLLAAVAALWLGRSILLSADMGSAVALPRWFWPGVILVAIVILLIAGGAHLELRSGR